MNDDYMQVDESGEVFLRGFEGITRIKLAATGCPDCDKLSWGLCLKHKLEYLKYCADTARNEYEAEVKKQKEKDDEHSTD